MGRRVHRWPSRVPAVTLDMIHAPVIHFKLGWRICIMRLIISTKGVMVYTKDWNNWNFITFYIVYTGAALVFHKEVPVETIMTGRGKPTLQNSFHTFQRLPSVISLVMWQYSGWNAHYIIIQVISIVLCPTLHTQSICGYPVTQQKLYPDVKTAVTSDVLRLTSTIKLNVMLTDSQGCLSDSMECNLHGYYVYFRVLLGDVMDGLDQLSDRWKSYCF